MPLPSLHPSLPQNPTAGSSSFGSGGRSLGSAAVASSANAGGSVNRDTLKGLQDVVWSDDEVRWVLVMIRLGLRLPSLLDLDREALTQDVQGVSPRVEVVGVADVPV